MSTKSISTRYAHALHLEAQHLKQEVAVAKDLIYIQDVVAASPELRMLLRSPIIEGWRKKKVLREVFSGKVSDLTLAFVDLVVEKGREKFFREISQSYQEMLDRQNNVLRVHVRSASQLPDSIQKNLEQTLSTKTGKTIRATYSTDESLIGGLTVTIGDTVMDGSLRYRLNELRNRLAHN